MLESIQLNDKSSPVEKKAVLEIDARGKIALYIRRNGAVAVTLFNEEVLNLYKLLDSSVK